jgi:hypothetical protein
MCVFVRSLDEFEHHWKIMKANAREKKQIFAFLLYTESDEKAMEYFAKKIKEMCELWGGLCQVFMIMHPPEEYLNDEKYRQWVDLVVHHSEEKENKPDNLVNVFYPMKPDDFNPNKTIEVARALGVPIQKFPCIVFFKDIHSEERIIYRLPKNVNEEGKATNRQLDELFDAMTLTRDEEEKLASAEQLVDERWRKLDEHVSSVAKVDKMIDGYEKVLRHANRLGNVINKFSSIFPR